MGPVYAGELQCRGLAMKVFAFDDDGKPVVGQEGELVCAAPFPSMPIYFWNDPDGKKYHSAYFDVYPGIWRHGDYIVVSEHGGVVMHGRSDATLNPGGVRIGTAELYRQVEQLDEVILGCVLQAGQGQNVARQVSLNAGIPQEVPAMTINKVCGSGMKAAMLAHDTIRAGSATIAVAGGMESMSNAPYLLPKARQGLRMGHRACRVDPGGPRRDQRMQSAPIRCPIRSARCDRGGGRAGVALLGVTGAFLLALFTVGFNSWLFFATWVVSVLAVFEQMAMMWILPVWTPNLRGGIVAAAAENQQEGKRRQAQQWCDAFEQNNERWLKSTIATLDRDGQPQLSYEDVDTGLIPPRPRLYGLVGAEIIEEHWQRRQAQVTV